MKLTPNEFILYGAIAGSILGLILGLVLVIVGAKKGKFKLGVIGLLCSVVVGLISGIFSLIVTAIFLWLILKKPEQTKSQENLANSEIPSDVKIENFDNR